jgi:hypothetical protein
VKRFFSFLVLGVLAALLPAEARTKSPEKERIPVLAWFGVPEKETTPERYRELADCGFNLNFSGFSNLTTTATALDIAQSAGVAQYISLPELQKDPEGTARRFKDHPALAGYHLRDEPSAADFPHLAKWARRIQAVDPQHPCYVNLFPNYATPAQLAAKSYREYVERFAAEVPVPFLSFDHYPVTAGGLRSGWYENLEIVSEVARKSGKPFWAFALAVAHDPYPEAQLEHLRLQAFSDLAYGAACVQYFTYWTPESTVWNFHLAPIDVAGKRTPVYDRVRQVNAEVQGLARVFSGATVVSVGHTGALPSGTHAYEPADPVVRLDTGGRGAVVSLLEKGRSRYLVIVNRDYREALPLTVELKKKARVREERKDGKSEKVSRTLVRQVEPGDVVVLRWANDSD